MESKLLGKDEEKIKELIFSEEIVNLLSTLKVTAEVIKEGAIIVKGGSLLLSKEDIPGYEGKMEDAVNQINNLFKTEEQPYYASLHVNEGGNVRIRMYRVSEKFEIERYTDNYKKISKYELDKLKKRFDEGHMIAGKDDFYNDLFLRDCLTERGVPLSSDEIIYALSIDTNHFDVVMLNDESRELRIHVVEPKKVGLKDTISLMKKFRPEDIELENGWIVMWFD